MYVILKCFLFVFPEKKKRSLLVCANCQINSLCQQFSLYQSISEPTHFKENSISLIDLLLVRNKDRIIFSGVGDPFLQQDLSYHCPVFGVFNFSKPKIKCLKRRVWQYDRGDYDLLKQKASSSDWNSLQNLNCKCIC